MSTVLLHLQHRRRKWLSFEAMMEIAQARKRHGHDYGAYLDESREILERMISTIEGELSQQATRREAYAARARELEGV